MMELNSEYLPFFSYATEPMLLVATIAFGIPLLMLVLTPFSYLLNKIEFLKPVNMLIYGTLVIMWLPGFIISILLLFLEVSIIKMYLIMFLLFIFSFVFNFLNANSILAFTTKLEKIKKPEKVEEVS